MRILSLSGGGFQAYFTALVLARFEEERGPLLDHFDLFIGTSAGSMVAAGGALGTPMEEVCEVFRKEGPKIFSPRAAPSGVASVAMDIARYVRASKYDGKRLNAVISGLSSELRMRDVRAGLMVTAVRMRDAEPMTFSDASTPDMLISDAIMASSAAPMMFPAHKIGNDCYADGALYANTPDILGLDHVVSRLGVPASEVSMLSVGAMNLCPPLKDPESANLGIIGWLQENRIFRTMTGVQAKMVERIVGNVLGDRYHRVDAPADFPGRNDVGLDLANDKAMRAAETAAKMTAPDISASPLFSSNDKGPEMGS